MEIALSLIGLLAFFSFIFVFSKETYVSTFSQYLSMIIVVLISFFIWQYSIIQNYNEALIFSFRMFFFIIIFTFSIYNFYVFYKLGEWIYKIIVDRYVR